MTSNLIGSANESDNTVGPDDSVVLNRLEATLAYARERSYTGWDYGDGMSSRIFQTVPIENKWLNIAVQEAIKRFPVNIRPLLLVEQHPNYKGLALFAMANQTLAQFPAQSISRDVDYGLQASSLAEQLVDRSLDGYNGYCAGYPHPIQHLDGLGKPDEPDIVNTSFGVKALLRAGEYDQRYPEFVRSVDSFILEDLNYSPPKSGRGAVIDYHTKFPQEHYTPNAGALGARALLDVYAHYQEPELLEQARGLLDHIEDLQTDRGGWMYRDPPEASHLSMDTHHNGFIIETYQRYQQVTGDDRYDDCLEDALTFFREDLFEDNGAPNFDESSSYPRDIHASTQGVLVFTYAGDLAFARRILQWVFENLYVGDGQFYYRKERFFTRRVTLMRWCEAWMAFAMSEYLAARLSK